RLRLRIVARRAAELLRASQSTLTPLALIVWAHLAISLANQSNRDGGRRNRNRCRQRRRSAGRGHHGKLHVLLVRNPKVCSKCAHEFEATLEELCADFEAGGLISSQPATN